MTEFTHLHIHTEYSLLDGACRINKLIQHVKDIGQKAIAITDHGAMYGCVDFYTAAKAAGIKPIIGCEVYVAERTRFDKVHGIDSKRYHLILLCENETGYQNLIKLVSKSWTEGFYTKPRVDKELLEKYHDGLICLSACLAGEIPNAILANDYEKAKETALWYDNVFGHGNYFLELQDHGLPEQKRSNPEIIRLARELDIPLVCTNDAHYIHKEDADVQKILLCIQTKHTINEDTGMGFATDEFYVKTGDEMAELFSYVPDAIENTNKIAERCNFDFVFGETKLPVFDVPDNQDHFEYFKALCYDGFKKRYTNPPAEYKERLDYELGVINQMGFVDYFLIVWDFINHSRKVGIPVGPGRGSGAGSICAYCVGITNIDPMRYNLLFERFLNPERVSMPDFDIDFCYERREEVIDYVKEKYGEDHVAQIATFGTMAAKGAIRDVGRVLGVSLKKTGALQKEVPNELGMTIAKALESSQDFRRMYDTDPEARNVVDIAMKIEGMPRNTGMHAAGVVISRLPVDEYVPLFKSGNSTVTQYYKGWVEKLGLLKMDFLGLRTLTVLSDAEKLIRKKDPNFSIEEIDVDDKETYDMLAAGGTSCVFQCESTGIKSLMINMQPKNLEDIIAVIALYRPGPMDFIPSYLENRKHPDKIKYHTPELKPILDVTYGTIVYQEQVMQIFRDLAGYSLGASDMVRRAIAKKQADVLAKQRQYFLYGSDGTDGGSKCDGCIKRGISEEAANKIFDDMASFASYAFNKSHSAAYALISFQTAWLRCHYPQEFMSAMLTSVLSNTDKVVRYIADCQSLGFDVLPPHVNNSEMKFSVEGKNVRFGLLAIKNVSENFIKAIINERTNGGPYISYFDFCKRNYGKDFNRRSLEHIIKAGALDNLGPNRHQMLEMIQSVMECLDYEKKKVVTGQFSFFDSSKEAMEATAPAVPDIPEFSEKEILQYEKESTGIYMSGHPMTDYSSWASHIHAARVADLLDSKPNDVTSDYKSGQNVKICVIISSIKKKITKNDTTMAYLTVEDVTGSIEVVVFPKKFLEYGGTMTEDMICEIDGRLELADDEPSKLTLDSLKVLPPASALKFSQAPPKPEFKPKQRSKYMQHEESVSTQKSAEPEMTADEGKTVVKQPEDKKLYIKLPNQNSELTNRTVALLKIFNGSTPVYFYFNDTREYKVAKFKISVDENLLKRIRWLLGSSNVVLK